MISIKIDTVKRRGPGSRLDISVFKCTFGQLCRPCSIGTQRDVPAAFIRKYLGRHRSGKMEIAFTLPLDKGNALRLTPLSLNHEHSSSCLLLIHIGRESQHHLLRIFAGN